MTTNGKLYYQTPYVKTFEAEVLSCQPGKGGTFAITLNQTAFYPEGGGQPSDRGVLETASASKIQVLDVQEKNDLILHYTDGPLTPGTKVTGILDWDYRYENMQQHSGEHLLSGLIHRKFGYDNVGFHMGSEEITIDFNGMLTREQLLILEERANRILYENRPIRCYFPEEEELKALDYRSKKALTGAVRIVEIPGGDICACCGTHVETTGEIGIIKVTGMIHYKGGVRISMLCGLKAWRDYEKKQDMLAKISVLLSAKPDALDEAVSRLKQESGRKDGLLSAMSRSLMEEKANSLPESDKPLLVFEPSFSMNELRQYATLLTEQKKASVALVCGNHDGTYQYTMVSKQLDLRTAGKAFNQELAARGGGSAQMFQGSFQANQAQIEAVFSRLFG